MKEMELQPYFMPYKKQFDMAQIPKYESETMKFLEKNIMGTIHDTGFRNDFLDIISKSQATRTIYKLDFIKNNPFFQKI